MKKRLLNVGSGESKELPEAFADCEHVRVDIDASCNPDIVAPMTNLGEIGRFDIVLCSHALEHIYPHETVPALKEFWRVLKMQGHCLIFVPDLEGIQANELVLYHDQTGPITGLDLIYGHRRHMATQPHMAHHNGFTAATLTEALLQAGFAKAQASRQFGYNLMAVGIKA
jgi:predicted SAM-dependent methyltransferase